MAIIVGANIVGENVFSVTTVKAVEPAIIVKEPATIVK